MITIHISKLDHRKLDRVLAKLDTIGIEYNISIQENLEEDYVIFNNQKMGIKYFIRQVKKLK